VTTTATAVVRRASTLDAGALLALATRFVARSPFWGLVAPNEERVRTTILQGLGGAAGTAHLGAVFVLEEGGQIVGAIVGAMATPPWSLVPVAEEVGGWVDEKHMDRVEDLRDRLRAWARSARSPAIRFGNDVERL
jgi:hypothetical protein